MPELPEVETVCRGLASSIAGETIENIKLLRSGLRIPFPKNFAKKLKRKRITAITRRAKYILMHLDDGHVVIAHLGMSGKMLVKRRLPETLDKHDHVVMFFSGGQYVLFNDPRRFGLMALTTKKEMAGHTLFKHLGPEPLDKFFSPQYLSAALGKRNAVIKVALMDQKLVVGVGNIYACEALFKAGVSPLVTSRKAAHHAPKIIAAIRTVLKAAIKSGGSTLRDYVRSSGDAGYFQHHFNVYGREGEPCYACRTKIKRIVQAARSTFYCPHCQK